jgi:hypothetical protein
VSDLQDPHLCLHLPSHGLALLLRLLRWIHHDCHGCRRFHCCALCSAPRHRSLGRQQTLHRGGLHQVYRLQIQRHNMMEALHFFRLRGRAALDALTAEDSGSQRSTCDCAGLLPSAAQQPVLQLLLDGAHKPEAVGTDQCIRPVMQVTLHVDQHATGSLRRMQIG